MEPGYQNPRDDDPWLHHSLPSAGGVQNDGNAALNVGVTPVEVKEILYQSVPYVGIAKAVDFIYLTNEIFTERGIALPLEGQSTTTPETRFRKRIGRTEIYFRPKMIDKIYQEFPG